MNDIRSSYIKVLPLVFLAALLATGLQIYKDFHFSALPKPGELVPLEVLITFIKNGVLWAGIGWAFKRMKEAALAFGTFVLLFFVNLLFNKMAFIQQSIVLNNLQTLLFNFTFLPALVFGVACFKTRGIIYFLPLAVFAYAITLFFQGSAFLHMSPYNTWYRALRIDEHFRIYSGDHTFRMLNLLSYTFHIATLCSSFIIISECFQAATLQKKFRQLFHIDFSNRYTKPGAVSLFFALRLMINLLVIGLYTYPFSSFIASGSIYYHGMSLFSFIVTMAAGLVCLAVTVLYYRKFLVEYFISIRKKTSWLFWIVNIPIVGMLVFPFVVLAKMAINNTEERTTFYFNDAMYYQKPYKILVVMLVISLLGLFVSPNMDGSGQAYWLLWFAEVCLLIWYATSASGFYAILTIGAAGLVFFLASVYIDIQEYYKPVPYTFNSHLESPINKYSISLWLISAFNIVQYTVLLPVFHLNKMKVLNGA